jgi:hypothetical protein
MKESLMLHLKQSGQLREEIRVMNPKSMTARTMKIKPKMLNSTQSASLQSRNFCSMYTELEPARIS